MKIFHYCLAFVAMTCLALALATGSNPESYAQVVPDPTCGEWCSPPTINCPTVDCGECHYNINQDCMAAACAAYKTAVTACYTTACNVCTDCMDQYDAEHAACVTQFASDIAACETSYPNGGPNYDRCVLNAAATFRQCKKTAKERFWDCESGVQASFEQCEKSAKTVYDAAIRQCIN